MGFYVSTTEVNLHIIPEKFDIFFERAAYMIQPEVINKHANGGSYTKDGVAEKWYGWTKTSDLKRAIDDRNIIEWFKAWGFDEVRYDNEFYYLDFYYNTKTSNEQFMLKCLAPAFSDGDYIIWTGEDDSFWKNVFNDGKMNTFDGRVVFDDETG
jgi:hypothetical protein